MNTKYIQYKIFVHIIHIYLMEIFKSIFTFNLHFNKTNQYRNRKRKNSLDIELKVKNDAKLEYNGSKAMKVRSTQSLPEFIMSWQRLVYIRSTNLNFIYLHKTSTVVCQSSSLRNPYMYSYKLAQAIFCLVNSLITRGD